MIAFLLAQKDPALRDHLQGIALARLDARSFAFVSDQDGHPEIYVMNTDDNNMRRLTTSR